MPEMTDWYPGHIKPLADRPGKYEREWSSGTKYKDWWTGNYWTTHDGGTPAFWKQNLPWRGLTERGKEGRK